MSRRRRTSWSVWIAVAIAAVAIGGGLLLRSRGAVVPVETAAVVRGTAIDFVEEQATTRLRETILVTTPYDGRVLPPAARAGDRVAAGEVLATMETLDLERRLAEAEAAVRRIDASIDRNDDAGIERLLLVQAEALADSVARAVEAAQERVRAGAARESYYADRRERAETSAEAGAVSDIELEEARYEALETAAQAAEDRLVLRAAEAILVAARIGPRLVGELIDRKALGRAVLERERDEAVARLALLKDDLERAVLRSPIDGMVLRRAVENVRVLPAGAVLLELGDPAAIEVEVELLSADASRVRAGMPVEILGAAPQALPGVVDRVEPRGFTKVSSLGVEQQRVVVVVRLGDDAQAIVEEAGRRLGPGYRVRARVVLGTAEGAALAPRSAIFRDEGGAWAAFVVRDGRAAKTLVEVGILNDAWAEVRAGVEPGDDVVLAPPASLEDGARVRTGA